MNPLSGTKDFLSTGILEQSRKIQDLKAENEKLKYELDDYKNRIEPNYIKMVEYLEYLETQYNENIEDLEAQYNDRLAKYQNDAEEYYNNQCKDLEINLTRYKELIEPTYLGKIKELEEKLNQENEKPTCIKKIDELEPKYKEKIKSLEARYNNVIHNHQQAEEMYNKKLKELTAEIETYKETTKHLEEENSKLNQERLNDLNNYIKPKIEPVYEEKIRNLEAGYNDKLVKAQKESKEYYYKQLQDYTLTLTAEQKEIESKYKEMVDKLRQEKENCLIDLNKYKQKVKQLEDLAEKNQNYAITLKDEQIENGLKYKMIINKLNQEKTHFQKNLNKYKENINKLEKELSQIKEDNCDAPIPCFNDEALNNLVNFTTNIINLQNKLEKYVTTLKGSIDINVKLIKELYVKYHVKSQNYKDKILMKSTLQRYILEKVLEYADDYFKIKESELGFPEIYERRKPQSHHPFISSTAQRLNQSMAEYRFIRDENKRKYAENMAEDIIKDIVRIFKFSLLTQEPKCEIHWFKNDDKIMPKLMRGQWDDDYLNDFVVDICYFPLIVTMNSNDDFSKSKVYSYAKVYPRNIAIPQENKFYDLSLNETSDNKYKKSSRNSGDGLINPLAKKINRKTSVEDQNAASSSLSSSDKVITSPQDTALQIVFAYDNLQNADSDEDDKNFNEDMKEKDDKNLSGRVQTTMAV
ncbi:1600_t:CDS:2 [Entrophospora sp. SA101]|nr:10437_t:CDS:2 [Entrophospora sp. SA101]CAJ0643748.1 1600_t:CDS:2 [Entrophospora sp. SA101]